MKSTDMARKDRDLRKSRKKEEVLARKMEKEAKLLSELIKLLRELSFIQTLTSCFLVQFLLTLQNY